MLSLLAYQGKTLIDRVDRLESNTAAIMYTLGIPQTCRDTRYFRVKKGLFKGNGEIKQSNPGAHRGIYSQKNP